MLATSSNGFVNGHLQSESGEDAPQQGPHGWQRAVEADPQVVFHLACMGGWRPLRSLAGGAYGLSGEARRELERTPESRV